jgi:hypothetical protein
MFIGLGTRIKAGVWVVILLGTLCVSCVGKDDKAPVAAPPAADQGRELAGTWVMQGRIEPGKDGPVGSGEGINKLNLMENGTFTALLQVPGAGPTWLKLGQGAFVLHGSELTFHWDTGQRITLLIVERSADRMVLHHGRCLAPLKDGKPLEVFVKEKAGR